MSIADANKAYINYISQCVFTETFVVETRTMIQMIGHEYIGWETAVQPKWNWGNETGNVLFKLRVVQSFILTVTVLIQIWAEF